MQKCGSRWVYIADVLTRIDNERKGEKMIELFGVSGVVVFGVCCFLCLLDLILGQPLFMLFDEYTNPEYYRSVSEKRADPDRYKYQTERREVYERYKEYLRRGLKEQGINTYLALFKARYEYDYKSMYNIIVDIEYPDSWEQMLID